jgi:uncharacterized protein (TIGR03086 family)
MDVIESLDQTFRHTGTVIAGVRPEQLDAPTPCAEWTVRDLLQHMVGVVAGMGAAASGQEPALFELDADLAGQFERAAVAAMAGWRTPGVLDRVIDGGAGPMPGRVLAGINLLDTATHTWDLATATGQPADLPPAVAESALEASQQIVSSEIRAGRFGPEQPAPEGAGPTEQLVTFLGRTP